MGSLVTRKTYEPCDASGYDRYGMDVVHFAENSAQKWQLADQSGTFPAILGDLVGATIFLGGVAAGTYLAGPLLEPVLNFLGGKVSAETMNALAEFIKDTMIEKAVYQTLTNCQEPVIDNNEKFLAMLLWLLFHGH